MLHLTRRLLHSRGPCPAFRARRSVVVELLLRRDCCRCSLRLGQLVLVSVLQVLELAADCNKIIKNLLQHAYVEIQLSSQFHDFR